MTQTQGTSRSQESSSLKPFSLFGYLWEQKWAVTRLSLLFVVLLAPVAYFKVSRHYEATAILRLSPTQQVLLSPTDDGNGNYFKNFVKTQVSRIKQAPLIADAIKRLPVQMRENFVAGDASILDVAENLSKSMDVVQVGQTHLIALTMGGKDKESVTELLNQVMAVYLQKLDEEAKGTDNRRLAYLEQERRQLEAEINKNGEQLRLVAASGGASQLDAEANMFQFRWSALNQALVEAQNTATRTRIAYEGVLRRADAIRRVPLTPIVEEGLQNNPVLAQARQYTTSRIQQLNALTESMAAQNPDRKIVDLRTEGLKEYLGEIERGAEATTSELVTGKREIQLQTEIIQAEFENQTAQNVVADLKKQIAELDTEMAQRFKAFDQARGLSEDIESKQGLLKIMEDRIYRLRVESQAPGRVSVEGRARSKYKSNSKKILALWLLASFGLSAAFVALRGRLDSRITDRMDVESALGAPPSWPISSYQVAGRPDLPFARMSIDDPSSAPAVAIRSLALKLSKERENHGAQVVCFAGVGSHVGCTSIAINAAHGLAQICERVLVIDLNRRHPRVANLMLADAKEWSVLSVVNGEQPLSLAVYHDAERGVDCLFMPPETGSNQLSRKGIVQLLREARRHYEIIVVDSAPLLISDLTELIVIHSDIVCPVVRGRHSRYNDLVRTGELLQRLEVKAVAPVLNWYEEELKVATSKGQQEAGADLYADGELPVATSTD